MTHAEFASGMQDGTLECWLAEPYTLQRGLRRTIFTLLSLLYIAGPLIFIPLWAYQAGNWWLLIGIPVSYIATASAGRYSPIIFYFGCYWVGFIIRNGFSAFDLTTFYFFCALYGYLVWQLADTTRMACARQSLINKEELYDTALAEGRLRIIRLDASRQPMLTSEDIEAFSSSSGLSPLKQFPTVRVFSNIFIEALTYLLGFFTGLLGTAKAHAQGIDNLAPEKADSIMRQLKKGTVGLIALALGYAGIYSIWGLIAGILYVCLIIWFGFAKRKAT